MRNIFLRTIDNYYWIFVLMGLMGFLGLPDIYSYVLLVTVMAAFVCTRNMGLANSAKKSALHYIHIG